MAKPGRATTKGKTWATSWLVRLVTAGAALAVLVTSPWLMLGKKFEFGEAELRAAVEGEWTLRYHSADGAAHAVTLAVTQGGVIPTAAEASAGWVAPAAACGTRSLVRSAAACMDHTIMPLVIRVAGGEDPGGALTGEANVYGTALRSIQLKVARGRAAWLDGELTPHGKTVRVELVGARDAELVRR